MYNELFETLSLKSATSSLAASVLNLLNIEKNLRWRQAVCRLAQSTAYWDLIVPTKEDGSLRKSMPDLAKLEDGYRLISYAGTYGTCSPALVKNGTWPYDSQVIVTPTSKTSATLSYGGKSVQVHCSIDGNVIAPEWPEDTGIKGAIECPAALEMNKDIVVPALLQYPVADALIAVKENDDSYKLLDRHGLADPFFFADSQEEQLAVLVLAIYKETHHG